MESANRANTCTALSPFSLPFKTDARQSIPLPGCCGLTIFDKRLVVSADKVFSSRLRTLLAASLFDPALLAADCKVERRKPKPCSPSIPAAFAAGSKAGSSRTMSAISKLPCIPDFIAYSKALDNSSPLKPKSESTLKSLAVSCGLYCPTPSAEASIAL